MKSLSAYLMLPVWVILFFATSCSKNEESSAEQTTYSAVSAKLEPGHEFFMITGFEGEIDSTVEQLTPLIQAVVRGLSEEGLIAMPMDGMPLNIKEAVRAMGMSAVSGVGYSSRREASGMFHNRTFVYMPQGRSGLFLLNGENRQFTLAQRAPAHTWLLAEAYYDLSQLVPVAENVLQALVGAEMTEPLFRVLLEQPVGNELGMPTWADMLAQATVSVELVVAADKDLVAEEFQGVAIPSMDFYVQLTGPVRLFKNQLEELVDHAESTGQTVRRSTDHIRIEIQEDVLWSIDGDWTVRPVIDVDFATESIRVYSNRAFEEIMTTGASRLQNQLDFQQATRNLPSAGTSRFYASKQLVGLGRELLHAVLQTEIEEETDPTGVAVMEELQKLAAQWLDSDTGIAGVYSNTRDGLLYHENHIFSHRTKLIGAIVVDALSSTVLSQLIQVPSMVMAAGAEAIGQSTDVVILQNLRGLGMMVKMYHMEANQPVRLGDLKVKYDYEITPVAGEVYPDFLFPVEGPWEYVVEFADVHYVLDHNGNVTMRDAPEE